MVTTLLININILLLPDRIRCYIQLYYNLGSRTLLNLDYVEIIEEKNFFFIGK